MSEQKMEMVDLKQQQIQKEDVPENEYQEDEEADEEEVITIKDLCKIVRSDIST
jgi:hypothetical protein